MLISAVMCAPWPGLTGLRATLGVLGAGALVYSAIVFRRARRQLRYTPIASDWVWHVVLPALAYAAVMVSGVLSAQGSAVFFVLAAATLLLLCVGIHNAWDTVTYLMRYGTHADPGSWIGLAHAPVHLRKQSISFGSQSVPVHRPQVSNRWCHHA